MTAVDVDALDKLREAATPGPWERGGYQVVSPGGVVAETDTTADAALIVAAVNALPDLIAEVRRGRALREVFEQHALAAFTGTESACACDRRWVPNREYRAHLAAAAVAAYRAAQDGGAEEARRRVEKVVRCGRGYTDAEHWVDGYYACPGFAPPALAPQADR